MADKHEVLNGAPEAASAAAGAPAPSRKTVKMDLRQKVWIAGGVIAVIALLIAGGLAWQATSQGSAVLSQVAGTQITSDPHHPGQDLYTDSGTKFRLDFPASWSTRAVGGADVRLLAGPGGGDLMSIRVVTLDTGSSGSPTAVSLKPYLDTIVNEPTVKIVREDQIVMDNLPGWYYVYTFTDSTSHAQGVHAQYFLIRGSQLYSIVFQALPTSDFAKLAPVYQQVANSIQFY